MSTPLPSASARTGALGKILVPKWPFQLTSLICRMGFARLAETSIRNIRGKGEHDNLGAMDKILASSIGGALATWNQPIEVIRVEVSIVYRYDLQTFSFFADRLNFLDAIYGQRCR